MRLLLAIQQKATARKRTAEVISNSIASHQEGLGGDVIDLRSQRKNPPSVAASSTSNRSEFICFVPLLPMKPHLNMMDGPRFNLKYLFMLFLFYPGSGSGGHQLSMRNFTSATSAQSRMSSGISAQSSMSAGGATIH